MAAVGPTNESNELSVSRMPGRRSAPPKRLWGPALQQRVAWEIDNQLRNVDVSEKDHKRRRIGIGFGVTAIAVVAILGFLTFAQRSINRPDLIQLRPTGLLRVSTSGDTTRLIEEQVTVAVVSPDNQVLYQLSGGPGVPGGSIWYSPGPGRRAGQVIAKTGGILGWVAAEDLPPRGQQRVPTWYRHRRADCLRCRPRHDHPSDRPCGTGHTK